MPDDPDTTLGVDLAFPDGDLDPHFATVAGIACLAQDLLARYETPEGSMFWDLLYGKDLRELAGAALGPGDLARHEAETVAQALLDPRVQDAAASFEALGAEALRVRLRVETAQGPYDLVLEASKVTVKLLEVARG